MPSCLNPCFNGICSAIAIMAKYKAAAVLILVLMEYALRFAIYPAKEGKNVS